MSAKVGQMTVDEEERLKEIAVAHPAVEVRSWKVLSMIAELRSLRLSDADREALRWLFGPVYHDKHDHDARRRATDIVLRLLGEA